MTFDCSGNNRTTQEEGEENESTKTTTPPYKPWQLYPQQYFEDLKVQHGVDKVKLVHMVRHAEGTHNVEQNYKDLSNLDARLTPKGMQQCQSLATSSAIRQNPKIDLDNDVCVLTSTMTRCVQTALHSFPHLAENPEIPFIAHDHWRETVNYMCDKRRTITEIAKDFPRVQFHHIEHDHDEIWERYCQRVPPEEWNEAALESAELHAVAHRGRQGFLDLQQRPETQIVVCSHSAFLRCILNWGQDGGVPRLMDQRLDERPDKMNHKLFHYHCHVDPAAFEAYMREDYDNCELRSFCLLVQDDENNNDDSRVDRS